MNEEKHFAQKSSSGDRARARRFYKSRKAKIKAMQKRLKDNKAAEKRKEIMAKSQRTGEKKRKKRKYNTKNHISDSRLKKGAQAVVNKWFSPTPYRVIKSFSINSDIDAVLNEKMDFYGNESWVLTKRNGKKYRLEINKGVLAQFIKHEALIETEDFI
jgi:hypothetical protein